MALLHAETSVLLLLLRARQDLADVAEHLAPTTKQSATVGLTIVYVIKQNTVKPLLF